MPSTPKRGQYRPSKSCQFVRTCGLAARQGSGDAIAHVGRASGDLQQGQGKACRGRGGGSMMELLGNNATHLGKLSSPGNGYVIAVLERLAYSQCTQEYSQT